MSNNGAGNCSNAGVETGCSSLLFQVSQNKVQTALLSPLMLQIGMSGDYGVGLVIHIGKVRDDKKVGTTEKRQDGVRFGVQFGC